MNISAKALARGVAVAASALILAAPALAQNPQPPGMGRPPPPQQEQPRKKRRNNGVAAGIAAGVLGGIAGAAIVGSQGQGEAPPRDYDYPPPPPPPPPGPRYGAYADDDEPDCRIVRKPVYDEDGEVVSYKTRRVCR